METKEVKVKVLFFAGCRDITGTAGDEIELQNTATLQDLEDAVFSKHPRLQRRRSQILYGLVRATNFTFATNPNTRLKNGDKVAFFPPVSGG